MQSVVVAVKRRLRHVLRVGRVPQAAAGPVHTYGAQVLPGHRFFFSSFPLPCFFSGFFLVLWLAVPWSSEQRTPPCTTATFPVGHFLVLFCQVCRQLAAANVLLFLFLVSSLASFLVLWLAVPWTSEQRTPPCTTATLLSRPLSCSFLPGLPTTCCCECSRRPWGMCLSLLPSGAFSHISPPPRASIGLELALTQTWRTPFFGAVRFPPSR